MTKPFYLLYSCDKIVNPPLYVQEEINRILEKISKKVPDFKIIDFGSGTGRLTIPLLKNNYKVTAVDTDKKSLKYLKKYVDKIGKEKNLKMFNIIQRVNYYSYIVGCDILHHIDIDKYLNVFYKALQHNGKIIFSEPNSLHLFWWLFVILFLNFTEEKGMVNCNFISLRAKLIKSSFRNIKITGFGLFPPHMFANIKILSRLNNILGNLPILKLFSFRLIIEASK